MAQEDLDRWERKIGKGMLGSLPEDAVGGSTDGD